jgi:hypothetical protein
VNTSGTATGNSDFTVNVVLNLASGASINGFDVRLNYTGYSFKGFHAISLNFTNNIFEGLQGTVAAACIDGISPPTIAGGCPSSDPLYTPEGGIGFVHFAELIAGANVTRGGFLFSVKFNVTGPIPTRVLYFDYAHLVVAAINLQVVTLGGVYANSGVAAFFNYKPCSLTNSSPCSLTPSILPGQPATFDATGSFDADNPSATVTNYAWSFGDGSSGVSGPSDVTVPHVFSRPGNYSVQLIVTMSDGKSGNLTRTVEVSPALGGLQIFVHDSTGASIGSVVLVELFNSTSQSSPRLSADSVDGEVVFSGLSPGTYVLEFSGVQIENYVLTESVVAGWTSQYGAYIPLKPVPPSSPDYAAIIFLASTGGFIAVVALFLVLRRRSRARVKSRTGKYAKAPKSQSDRSR